MSSNSPDHSQFSIDTRIDDIQIQLTDLVRRRFEETGLSQEAGATRMQVELSSLARAVNPRTALRLTVPQAIDLAYKAGLDLELQASIELDGLTLFHGGALKRSAYADGTRMMAALEAEAAKALQTHLALNGLTVEDYIEAIKDQRNETVLDFAKATGAERMLALLDFRGCKVEIASRIYDVPEANLLANPDAVKAAAKVAAQETETAALRDLVAQRFGGTDVAPGTTKPIPAAPVAKRFKMARLPKSAREAPRPVAISTPEQERKVSGETARRALLAAQADIARSFALEVEKTGMSPEDVAAALDVQATWVKQLCTDEWRHVSLRKTLDLSQKIGLDVAIAAEVSLDGSALPTSGQVRLSDHASSEEFLHALTQSLQPALAWLRSDMNMSNQQMSEEAGLSIPVISKMVSPQSYKIAPQQALGVLCHFGCHVAVVAKTLTAPAATTKAGIPSETVAAQTPPITAAEAFDAHQRRLIGNIATQVNASDASPEDVARRVGVAHHHVERALRGELFPLPSVLALASGLGIDTKAQLRVSYKGRELDTKTELKASKFSDPAQFLSELSAGAREAFREIVQSDGRPQSELAKECGISQSHLCNLSREAFKVSPQSVLSYLKKMGAEIDLKFSSSYDMSRNLLRDKSSDVDIEPEVAPGMRR